MNLIFNHMTILSVIVPAYRAENYIEKNLRKYLLTLRQLKKKKRISDFELIVVIDGKIDKTSKEAKKVKSVKVIEYKKNMGKGHALLKGFEHASGNYITFLDADGDLHPDQLNNFFPYLATADLVVGSKRHPFSKLKYPFIRRLLSFGFQILSKILLGINIRDTQSGLKLMKREVLEIILPMILVKRYAFDLELCFLAQKNGFKITEAPIKIDFQGKSSINFSVAWKMFIDLLAIRYRYSIKRYYQNQFHRHHFNF